MSSELSILALTGLLTIVLVLLQVLGAAGQVGLPMLASPRDDMPKLTGKAGRMERASKNAIVALTLFAPAVLLLQVQGGFTAQSLLAAQLFLVTRVIHPVLYILGTHWVRTGVWVVGFLATAWLYLLAL